MSVFKRSRIALSLLALPILLSACASVQRAGGPESAHQAGPNAAPARKEATQAPAKPVLPDVELTDVLLYRFLLAEVALQRGHPGLSAQTYLDLARSTRDPRVARRAAQIAYETHQLDKATEAFKLWVELEPDSRPARQMLIALLLNTGSLDDARPYLTQFLEAQPKQAGAVFMQLTPVLVHNADKQASLRLMRDLAQPYPKLPEAHLAVGQVAAAAGMQDEALAEAKQALALRPAWDDALALEVQLLASRPDEALAAVQHFLEANPGDEGVRLTYARMLLDRKQYRESRDQFQRLLSAHPENADLAFTVALLSMQLGELDRAERDLQQALKNGRKDQDTIEYYLGQLAEVKKDVPAAIQHYDKVRGGQYAYPARLREAYLLGTTGKLAAAREMLHLVRTENRHQEVQVLLLEAQILRDARQYGDSYDVLQKGLEKFPDDPDILYETAMLADRLDKPGVMEKLMRKLIRLQPENANAYNALGYSFLERNIRIKEGMALVEKAYQLDPNDAAIVDSVGWGHYRQGQLDKSLEYLQRAYTANADPEIAAHLGEVLWVRGDREKAQEIWSSALKQHPDSEALQAVMKKFMK